MIFPRPALLLLSASTLLQTAVCAPKADALAAPNARALGGDVAVPALNPRDNEIRDTADDTVVLVKDSLESRELAPEKRDPKRGGGSVSVGGDSAAPGRPSALGPLAIAVGLTVIFAA